MRLLFIGDVVGSPGRRMVALALPPLIRRLGLDFVIANVENAAGGSGLTMGTFEELLEAGINAFTLGDHAYRKDEVHILFERSRALCRPANYPQGAPGPASVLVSARNGAQVGVCVLLGRVFMQPVDCPLQSADRIVSNLLEATPLVVVDMHAEATSEKQLVARYLDGRASAVLGTHTHVPTADQQILPKGTAFQTDVGMTGPYDSIIGRRYDRVLTSTLTAVPQHLDVATGDPRLCAALIDLNRETGRAEQITRVVVTLEQAERLHRDVRAPLPDSLDSWAINPSG